MNRADLEAVPELLLAAFRIAWEDGHTERAWDCATAIAQVSRMLRAVS